jgi:hypothetical protein
VRLDKTKSILHSVLVHFLLVIKYDKIGSFSEHMLGINSPFNGLIEGGCAIARRYGDRAFKEISDVLQMNCAEFEEIPLVLILYVEVYKKLREGAGY